MDAEGDPFYDHLSKKKDQLIHSDTWDADHLLKGDTKEDIDPNDVQRREAVRYSIRLYEPWSDDNDTTYTDVARVIESYEKSWVGDRVAEWRDGDHRELVPDPSGD
jgi:hypothetical protein